ncbi:MAG TPA: PaaI family thioesterase, partial [Actinomycetota bacterium]|nr:PaaI family thioesterase [Actinomycetota bacterium]
MLPTEAGPGTATFTMPASRWLLSPPGLVQLGTLAMLADGPLGCSIQTALPPFTGYTTAELSMNYARPVTADSGTLVCRGRLIVAGRSLGLSECTIEDGKGRLVAHGTSRCMIFPPMGPPPSSLPDFPVVEWPLYATPDPYLRPALGEVVPQATWDRMTGLEVMEAFISSELPAPPIAHLTGLRPVAAGDGTCTFLLPASGWLCSPLGKVEGGVIALLADTAIDTAVQTTLPPRTSYAALDLKVNFLRPVDADGADLTAVGTVVHRGRTIAVANAELTDGQGRRVAIATGTTMILPGRPWL